MYVECMMILCELSVLRAIRANAIRIYLGTAAPWEWPWGGSTVGIPWRTITTIRGRRRRSCTPLRWGRAACVRVSRVCKTK